MKKYKVTFEIHIDRQRKFYKVIEVEAGNKKMASIRAMTEINKDSSYSGLFKNITKVEEIKEVNQNGN